MKRLFLLLCGFFLSTVVSAHNSAQATAQASVIDKNTPILIEQFTTSDKTIEIIGKVGDNTCPMKYSVIMQDKHNIKTVSDFNTCSTVIRAKIIKDQLFITILDNLGGYVTYSYILNQEMF